jgi:catenin alpha
MGTKDRTPELERAIGQMYRKTKDLSRQLRKAVIDHVSDSFLDSNMPLLDLIEAAQTGNEKKVHERAEIFTKHAEKLVEVANLVCSMSNNADGKLNLNFVAFFKFINNLLCIKNRC